MSIKKGVVVAAHPLAARAGSKILSQGGNAVDAAIASAFALTVVEPYNSGLGGAGGFMLISLVPEERPIAVDYNMVAPGLARPNIFELMDPSKVRTASPHSFSKMVRNDENNTGHKSIGVPGTAAGLCLAQERFGELSLDVVMKPAIEYAKTGFEVTWYDSLLLTLHLGLLSKFAATRRVFLHDNRPRIPVSLHPSPEVDVFVQSDLARVLETISKEGSAGFYRGWVAHAIAEEMEANGGLLTERDLATYRPRFLNPGVASYNNLELNYIPANSGGPTVVEALNIVEGVGLSKGRHNSAWALHVLASAIFRAFSDRLEHLGDPDFVDTPIEKLVSKEYARKARRDILRGGGADASNEGLAHDTTTHLSASDKEGNMVSLTQTLGSQFGSGVTIPGTGMLMNNDMHWFDPEPGKPNSIAPRKKPLANMSPLLVVGDGKRMALGSSGGRRIVSALVQVVVNLDDFGMSLRGALASPRVHCESRTVVVDSRISSSVQIRLRSLGHDVVSVDKTPASLDYGFPAGIVLRRNGEVEAAVDPTRQGKVEYCS